MMRGGLAEVEMPKVSSVEGASVVDHRVHPADGVDLFSKFVSRWSYEVSEDDADRIRSQILDGRGAVPRAGVQNDLMALNDEGSCRSITEPIGAASDEYTTHARPSKLDDRLA
jgi:hypothetical protein